MQEEKSLTSEKILRVARDSMAAVEYCFLITRGNNDHANARLMQPFPPEEGLIVWFGTHPGSRKIEDIQNDQRLTLAYPHLEETAYVTLLGTAEVVSDPVLREQYWMDRWLDLYPDGPLGNDYILIKFTPWRVEVMNYSRQIHPNPYGLASAAVEKDITTGQWMILESPKKGKA
jgi:general stress protein 26